MTREMMTAGPAFCAGRDAEQDEDAGADDAADAEGRQGSHAERGAQRVVAALREQLRDRLRGHYAEWFHAPLSGRMPKRRASLKRVIAAQL
jgi:hypothetical protein